MHRADDRIDAPTDAQIIELYWQRDEAAIVETDRKYGRMLLGIAYNLLHDRLDCEECKNDVYIRVWNAIPPTRPTAFSAFITEITRRVAISKYKQKAKKRRIPSELTASLDDLFDGAYSDLSDERAQDAEQIGRVINNFVRNLPERRRYIFIDRFYLAEPVETIAKELSASVATVYREIERIKKDLRVYLERNDIYI